MKASLYELSTSYRNLIEQYNAATEDAEADSILLQIAQIEEPLEEKMENCCKILRELEAEETMYAQEIERLQQQLKSATNRKTNLKQYMKGCLEASGLPKPSMKVGVFKVWLQNNASPAVTVNCDPKDLPENLRIIVPIQYQPDTKAIVQAWKDGTELPESVQVTRGTHLRIL